MTNLGPAYARFKDRFTATSPAVRHMRDVVLPVAGRAKTDAMVDAYTAAVYVIQNLLKPEEPVSQTLATKYFTEFCMASSRLGPQPPSYASPAFIDEFWGPSMRYIANRRGISIGIGTIGAAYRDEPTDAARTTMLAVLGEHAATPWLELSDRILLGQTLYQILRGEVENERIKPMPNRRGHLPLWLVKGGLVFPMIRVLARPLPQGLSPEQRSDAECTFFDFAYWLALALAAVLCADVPGYEDVLAMLQATEEAVLAHSPWIWTRLCEIGAGRPLSGDDKHLGYAPLLFSLLAAVSPKAYAAAEAAGGEAILNKASERFQGLLPVAAHAVDVYRKAAGGVMVVAPFLQQTVYFDIAGAYFDVLTAISDRSMASSRRTARTQASMGPYCGGCGQRVEKTQLCGGCRLVRYCSPECQRKDWPKHKKACKIARKI